jgi:hypothetical protein
MRPNTRLEGAGMTATTLEYTGNDYAIYFGNNANNTILYEGLQLANLQISGNPSLNSKGGIYLRNSIRWTISEVWISGFKNNTQNGSAMLFAVNTYIGSVMSCRLVSNDTGVNVKRVGLPFGATQDEISNSQCFNAVTFDGQGEIQDNFIGVLIGNPDNPQENGVNTIGHGSSIRNYTIEGNRHGGIWNVAADSVNFDSCYFESNHNFSIRIGRLPRPADGTIGSKPIGCNIINCEISEPLNSFNTNNFQRVCIEIINGQSTRILNNNLMAGKIGILLHQNSTKSLAQYNYSGPAIETKIADNGLGTIQRDWLS